MATVNKARRARMSAPKAASKATTVVKPSIWTRMKTTAIKVAATIVRPFKAVARVVARPFKASTRKIIAREVAATRAFAARKAGIVVAKTAPVAAKATSAVVGFWRRALQPFLLWIAVGTALAALVFAAIAAPLSTLVGLVVGGLAMIALSAGVKRLEGAEPTSRAARVVLRGLEILARAGAVAAYLLGGVVTLALCSASWQFGVFAATSLALANAEVRGAGYLALFVYDVLTGSWAFATLWLVLYGLRSGESLATREIVDAPVASEIRVKKTTHGDFLRAKGTEELWGTEYDRDPAIVIHDDADEGCVAAVHSNPCTACGANKGALRVGAGNPNYEDATTGLCTRCFSLQCEEDALERTGVSLKARRVEVYLNKVGIERSAEFTASKFDATTLHWLETGWWRDRDGVEQPREWGCLHDGQVVATVVYDRRRKVYRATVMGRLIDGGVKTGLLAAKRAAVDVLNDEWFATKRMVDQLGEVMDNAHTLAREKA